MQQTQQTQQHGRSSRRVDYRLRESADSSDGANDRQSRCRPSATADDTLGKRRAHSGPAPQLAAQVGILV
ncbi:hypothetical protein AB4Z54_72120, partial [Streptomyces sp. MCAF7]